MQYLLTEEEYKNLVVNSREDARRELDAKMSAFTQKIHSQFKNCRPPDFTWSASENDSRMVFLRWLEAFLRPAFDSAKLPPLPDFSDPRIAARAEGIKTDPFPVTPNPR